MRSKIPAGTGTAAAPHLHLRGERGRRRESPREVAAVHQQPRAHVLSVVSPNGNRPTSASCPSSRETQAVLDEQGGEGFLSGAAAASDESGEEFFVESDDESLAAETAGMSGEEPPSHEGGRVTPAGSEQGDRSKPCTLSPDKIVLETIYNDVESSNNGEENQEDSVLVVDIHGKAPDEVIAVYEEAIAASFDDDNDGDEVVASAADDSSRPRAKKRRKRKGRTSYARRPKGKMKRAYK